MIKVLVSLCHYLPGYKSGGPLRTVANMVDRLGDRIDFRILTTDRDFGDVAAYPDVKVDSWSQVGRARVYYASPSSLSLINIQRLAKEVSPDVIYLNSFFSPLTIKFLILRRLGILPNVPMILAPRGEFSPGALSLKSTKKRLYLMLALRTSIYNKLIWQASSSIEQQNIQRIIGSNCETHIAPNLPSCVVLEKDRAIQKLEKIPGKVRIVFFSRISPMKNLPYVFEILSRCCGQISLDIYGPIEDQRYWNECETLMRQMPDHVQVHYGGSLLPKEVVERLSEYHFFILPTLGENFGHVILEALMAGCPAIISDQTPWLGLAAKQVGWDLPLDRLDRWQDIVQHCIDMDKTAYIRFSQAAHEFALEWISATETEQQNIALFMRAMETNKCAASPEL